MHRTLNDVIAFPCSFYFVKLSGHYSSSRYKCKVLIWYPSTVEATAIKAADDFAITHFEYPMLPGIKGSVAPLLQENGCRLAISGNRTENTSRALKRRPTNSLLRSIHFFRQQKRTFEKTRHGYIWFKFPVEFSIYINREQLRSRLSLSCEKYR